MTSPGAVDRCCRGRGIGLSIENVSMSVSELRRRDHDPRTETLSRSCPPPIISDSSPPALVGIRFHVRKSERKDNVHQDESYLLVFKVNSK